MSSAEKCILEGRGLKFDKGKLLMSLVPQSFIDGIAKVLTFGAEKYSPNSWQTIPHARVRYEDALLRHIGAWRNGEKNDSESGIHHLLHAACNIVFLLHLTKDDDE